VSGMGCGAGDGGGGGAGGGLALTGVEAGGDDDAFMGLAVAGNAHPHPVAWVGGADVPRMSQS
jgi:hypothetical protein